MNTLAYINTRVECHWVETSHILINAYLKEYGCFIIYSTPWASMASATLTKAAILAP
ncbi:hypothetical protein CH54_2386 [Yersinia rochesterensis]|uniref:Uncharacterized protein n=2 Tax=Yersinia TaxID=629 RepID=A0ABM5SSC7_9GAMM|nr:hypothetical protein DJ57_3249 [Yersinia rochesterensis]AJI86223.1 hypothetical protein AW19_3404 [Yersinia frederiksenii Y225]CFR02880.1 Uncharacterised protein [Yersinia kristensenii]AJJ37342.1 hypothetical protein CH54_2386 [Yersinia rochesterensis]CNE50358.1 Uncharacterised protein [Yersinia kristensenii]